MAGTLALLLALSTQASATLGEPESSVAADAQDIPSSQVTAPGSGPERFYEIASGLADVREYVNSSGVVYALTWNGRGHPHLKSILGSYYKEYKAARDKGEAQEMGRSSLTTTANVVVKLSGLRNHMGGRAYVPALVPTGVKAEALK